MVWDPAVGIILLICALFQIQSVFASPLPASAATSATPSRLPGRYRNHNPYPGRHYGTFEIEFFPNGNDEHCTSSCAPQPSTSDCDTANMPAASQSGSAATSPVAVVSQPGSVATSPVAQQPVQASAPGSAQTSAQAPPAAVTSANPPSAATSAPVSQPATGASNIFVAIDSGLPPSQIAPKGGHPEQGVGLANGHSKPIGTNKFYTNWIVGDQSFPVFTYPYSVQWVKGGGTPASWGVGISHIDKSDLVFGPGNPASYFYNPVGKNSIILGAAELTSSTALTTSNQSSFSIIGSLSNSASGQPLITFPVVQGMSMLTGQYASSTIQIASVIGFASLSQGSQVGSATKYIATLNDQNNWIIYVTPADSGSSASLTLSGGYLNGQGSFNGLVQVAKLGTNAGGDTSIYDSQVGGYVVDAAVSATADGSYSIAWQQGGDTSKSLAMFALPHHLESFAADTTARLTSVTLAALTKGTATAVTGTVWNLVESLPTSMGFNPWSPTHQSVTSLPADAVSLIQSTMNTEINQDYTSQTNLGTVYFSGKGLGKLASLAYLASSTLAENDGLAATALQKLKDSYATWVNNQAQVTLVYDTTWGGIVSSDGYTDSGADFGQTYYNDHMFHYGYFVYAGAVIATLDPSWLNEGTNKAFVNSLVRDYANPVADDQFPFSRCFDWYNGHSWAAGLFPAGDGKNLESSSEDTFASFAIKMWGKAVGDSNMEARGNLMLAIEARALNDYFLYQSTNQVEPSNFIGNKVSGILFDNKIDHTTYFGANVEYIEGIHILPMGAHSGLTRKANFVAEEWATYFSNGRVDNTDEAWRGLLYGSLALTDPVTSWNFFSSSSWNDAYLDNGASRSWYLAIAAGLGGVS